MEVFRRLLCVLCLLLSVGLVATAQAQTVAAPSAIGVLVGSAERSASICVNLDHEGDELEGSASGGTLRELELNAESTGWITVVVSEDGEFEVAASVEEVDEQHVFTYEITNLSLAQEPQGVGLLSVAVPLGGQVRPDDVVGGAGWSGDVSVGPLGGFVVYQSRDRAGIPIGGTATFRFSLPALPADDEGSGPGQPLIPPGLFVGADLQASRIEVPTVMARDPREPLELDRDQMCRDGLIGVAYIELPSGEGICIWGTMAVDPGVGADLELAIRGAPPDPRRPHTDDDLLVAVPLRLGEAAGPDPSVPEGWMFEAPPHPDDIAGFVLFEGPLGDEPARLGMTIREAPFATASLDADMDWTTGTCVVEVGVSPTDVTHNLILEVYHRWGCDAGTDEETGSFTGTTDEDGLASWSFHVTVRCPDGYEYLRLDLYRETSSGALDSLGDEIFELR